MKRVMKKSIVIPVVCLLTMSCAKTISEIDAPIIGDGVSFVATIIGGDSKVSTDSGSSSWEAGDRISVFSAAGEGCNKPYEVGVAGTVGHFSAVEDPVASAANYYAYYPYLPNYPSKLNAASSVGFAAVAAGAPVTDYRYMPVTVNTGCTFYVDPETGLSTGGQSKIFSACAAAPSNEADPVELSFVPVLPILEFGIKGAGTVATVKVAYTDKSTDALSGNTWLTGKGIFDVSTGTLTTTNTSSSAYCTLTATLKESDTKAYVDLDPSTYVRFQLVTGRFKVTKGLTLTITDKDGKQTVKKIWQDKGEVSSLDASGKCRHIYQKITLPYVLATAVSDQFPVAGGSAQTIISSSSAWTVTSKPEWITLSAESGVDGAAVTITAAANTSAERNGIITFKGADDAVVDLSVSQAGSSVVAAAYYSVIPANVDWTASYVQYVKDAEGHVIAVLTDESNGFNVYPAPSAVPDYTSGTTVTGAFYVKADASSIVTSEPASSVSPATVAPLTLTSDVKTHGAVKVGDQIWLAENYKTTKLADGTAIPVFVSGSTFWSSGAKGYMVTNTGEYVYSGWTLGFDTSSPAVFSEGVFAPEGWALPTKDDVAALVSAGYAALKVGGSSNFNALDPSPIAKTKTPATVAYFAIRTATPGTGSNSYMCGLKSDGTAVSSAQTLLNGLAVRLIKE